MAQIVALVGPTGVGKTEVSIELSLRLDAEIVGCDSMQVYRKMPILTQQPTPEQRAMVPHHLIDVVEPTEPFSVGQYRRKALEAIEDIQRRGKSVLLVGGTGLYFKALTNGLCEAPPADPPLRHELWRAVHERGSPAFHECLRRIDPVAATKIHPHDARRIVRALEVYELTNRPLSSFWRQTNSHPLAISLIGINRNRAELYERINRRVTRMIHEEDVVEEARRVLALPLSQSARQVHGLIFLERYLNGELSLEEAVRQWQQQVRHYARRQLTWFRAEPRIRWVTLGSDEQVGTTVNRILERLQVHGCTGVPVHQ